MIRRTRSAYGGRKACGDRRITPCLASVLVALVTASLGPAPALGARLETLEGPPETTLRVPAGWTLVETSRGPALVRDGRMLRIGLCGLAVSERDMSGRSAAARERAYERRFGRGRRVATAPARGGGCVIVRGPGARRVAKALHPRLGPSIPPAPSSAAAEAIARAARRTTMRIPRAEGAGYGLDLDFRLRTDATWAWDLATGYVGLRQVTTGDFLPERFEKIIGPKRTFARYGRGCWRPSLPLNEDNVIEPRSELIERDVPPSTRSSWRVVYAPPEVLADGTTRLRWSAFVASGEAIVGADGLLRYVRIFDHEQAASFAGFDVTELEFTAFPAEVRRREVGRICDDFRGL